MNMASSCLTVLLAATVAVVGARQKNVLFITLDDWRPEAAAGYGSWMKVYSF